MPTENENTETTKTDAQGTADKAGDADKMKGLQSLLKKNDGDGNAVAALLYSDNFQLREKNRHLESRLPGDGSVVLTPDEAKAWRNFSQLGDPKSVKSDLEAGRQAAAWKADFERTETLKSIAKDAGFAPDVFARLAKQDGIEVVSEESKGRDGKPVQKVLVKGEGDKTTPIEEYASKHWAEFMPALKPTSDGQPRRSQPSDGRPSWDTSDSDRFRREPGGGEHDERRALEATGRYQL